MAEKKIALLPNDTIGKFLLPLPPYFKNFNMVPQQLHMQCNFYKKNMHRNNALEEIAPTPSKSMLKKSPPPPLFFTSPPSAINNERSLTEVETIHTCIARV